MQHRTVVIAAMIGILVALMGVGIWVGVASTQEKPQRYVIGPTTTFQPPPLQVIINAPKA